VSARRGLVGRLVLLGLSEQAAERAVDAYAHELAEQIRARSQTGDRNWDAVTWTKGMRQAADIIDPEVSDGD
jgi:hypothetical protein